MSLKVLNRYMKNCKRLHREPVIEELILFNKIINK